MSDDLDEFLERAKADVDVGGAVVQVVMRAASESTEELAGAVVDLHGWQARAGLAFLATMHVELTRGGLRYLPDSPVIDAVIGAAEHGYLRAREVVIALPEPDAKAALANLAITYGEQRKTVLAGRAGMN